MTIPVFAKVFIDKDLDNKEIALKIATTIINFDEHVIIDYKIYEMLKQLAIESQNITLPEMAKVLKIKNEFINATFYISIIDSNYLSIDKFIYKSGNVFCFEKSEENKPILITMSK